MSSSQQGVTPSKNHIYKVLDKVALTGIPATVECKGKKLTISPSGPVSKLDKLEAHPDFLVGDPEEVVHMDWSVEWMPSL